MCRAQSIVHVPFPHCTIAANLCVCVYHFSLEVQIFCGCAKSTQVPFSSGFTLECLHERNKHTHTASGLLLQTARRRGLMKPSPAEDPWHGARWTCTLMELSLRPLMILSSSYWRQYTPLLFSERHWILCRLCLPHRQLASMVWTGERKRGGGGEESRRRKERGW